MGLSQAFSEMRYEEENHMVQEPPSKYLYLTIMLFVITNIYIYLFNWEIVPIYQSETLNGCCNWKTQFEVH